jgi:hypothetical protein
MLQKMLASKTRTVIQMEKYNLVVLIVGNQPEMLSVTQDAYSEITQQHTLDNTVFMLIFIGKTAHRIIAGKRIDEIEFIRDEIEDIPSLNSSDGEQDIEDSIHKWIDRTQSEMHSDISSEIRTAIFVNLPDGRSSPINPSRLLGIFGNTDFYKSVKKDVGFCYEFVEVSFISGLEEMANIGDEDAQFRLGLLYINGEGVVKDPFKGRDMLYKAYLRGRIDALFALADSFDDLGRSMYEDAAQRGHLKSQWLTGKQYYTYCIRGEGTDVDIDKAEYWLNKAAEQGHEEASNLLKEVSLLRKG